MDAVHAHTAASAFPGVSAVHALMWNHHHHKHHGSQTASLYAGSGTHYQPDPHLILLNLGRGITMSVLIRWFSVVIGTWVGFRLPREVDPITAVLAVALAVVGWSYRRRIRGNGGFQSGAARFRSTILSL
ncbi:hypothetical protein U1Q18_026728 [Sarracenia purpurea var. burkii]